MPAESDVEQIFSRQEQAVVYLFSRYWERIPEFGGKRIRRIHTHFPDFFMTNSAGEEEAVEFEYALAGFRTHLNTNDLVTLYNKGVRRLNVVYWEHNDDVDGLRSEIRREARFDVVFVCLKNSFQAGVRSIRGTEGLQTFWKFKEGKGDGPPKAYLLDDILDAAKKLGRDVKYLESDGGLYRVIGFNAKGSEFIDCEHWEQIHLFTTTTRFDRNRIPGKLFVKPTGCKYFNGYFDIHLAFEVVAASQPVRTFFSRFYFYAYDEYIGKSKCFVCSFNRLKYAQGKEIYNFLRRRRYALGVQSSIAIDDEQDTRAIDAIVAG
jgi:hypothetical protein